VDWRFKRSEPLHTHLAFAAAQDHLSQKLRVWLVGPASSLSDWRV
jgi:hypothetical protein